MQFGSGQFDREKFLSRTPVSKAVTYQSNPIHYGLPQWSVKEWKGILYSTGCPTQNFLNEYALIFKSVEVSSTFYAPVSKETLEQWSGQVPSSFEFLPKWPQSLTHHQLLNSHSNLIKDFIETISCLEEKLGPTLLQLPPHFSREYNRELFNFLQQIPIGFPLALELRHSSWYWPEEARINERLYDYLAKRKISLVVTDTPGRQDIFHLSSTGPDFVVRYLSDGDENHDRWRLAWWREKIDELAMHTKVHFIFHTEDNLRTPELVDFLSEEEGQLRRAKLKKDQEDGQMNLKLF